MGNKSSSTKTQKDSNFTKPKFDFNFNKPETTSRFSLSCFCNKILDGPQENNTPITINHHALQSLARRYISLKEKLRKLEGTTNSTSSIRKNKRLALNSKKNSVFIPAERPGTVLSLGSVHKKNYQEIYEDLSRNSISFKPSEDISFLSSSKTSEITEFLACRSDTIQRKNPEIVQHIRKETINSDDSCDYQDDFIDLSRYEEKNVVEIIIEDRRYIGNLLNGQPHGKGCEMWPDGHAYEGEYENGLRTGKGKFMWPDGSCYEGRFLKNEMSGFGIFKWKNGNLYEGEWRRSKINGRGKFTWSNGDVYDGEYFFGVKHGQGVFKWADGKIDKGYWKNGKFIKNI